MKITAQLSGVNRPLSVELRLIHFCSCDFDSQEEHDTSCSRGVLTKRSDFRSAQGLVRYSPFEGVEFGKKRAMEQRLQIQQRKPNVLNVHQKFIHWLQAAIASHLFSALVLRQNFRTEVQSILNELRVPQDI